MHDTSEAHYIDWCWRSLGPLIPAAVGAGERYGG